MEAESKRNRTEGKQELLAVRTRKASRQGREDLWAEKSGEAGSLGTASLLSLLTEFSSFLRCHLEVASPSGCTHLKPQSGSPKIGIQGRSLSRKSRNLVYFGKLVAGREEFSFYNQNNKQGNYWARRYLKVTPGLMARLSSKRAQSLASPNVKTTKPSRTMF